MLELRNKETEEPQSKRLHERHFNILHQTDIRNMLSRLLRNIGF